MYRSEDIGARKQSPPAAGSAKSFLPRWKIFHGVSHAGLRKNQCIRDRPEKEFPDEKVPRGRYALGLRKKSKAAMYRSENIGARKQSPPAAGSAKSFLPRWKSCPWQRCVLWAGVFFRRTKKKSPMKKFSMGYPTLDLEKISDAAVHRSGDMGRLGKIWPDPRSAGGGGRHAKSLGSKKKVACRVWLVRCSLYVREGASRVKIGVESM